MQKFLKIYLNQILGGIILLLLSANFLIWSQIFSEAHRPEMQVYFFDVGQGDSEFIESKDGTQILIDGGPTSQILSKLAGSLSYSDHFIDVVILTHPHADHVSGLIDVLKRYDVGVVIESGVEYNTAEAKEFEKIIQEKNIKRIIVDKPIELDFFGKAKLRFIYPDKSFLEQTLKNVHDSSLVSELDFENKKILFMGDAEQKIEQKLISENAISKIDILKVGHHGSKTSSKDFFLKIIQPKYAVISVGARNRYGHPTAEVLSSLAVAGSKIFRTDLNGTIEFGINNGELSFVKEK